MPRTAFKYDSTTDDEPSRALTRSEICRIFEVPEHLVFSNGNASYVSHPTLGGFIAYVDETQNRFFTDYLAEMYLWIRVGKLTGKGWRGLRRPDET